MRYYVFGQAVFASAQQARRAEDQLGREAASRGFVAGAFPAWSLSPTGTELTQVEARPAVRFSYYTTNQNDAIAVRTDLAERLTFEEPSWWTIVGVPA